MLRCRVAGGLDAPRSSLPSQHPNYRLDMLKQHPDAISHGRMRAFDAPTMLDSLVWIAMDAESLIM